MEHDINDLATAILVDNAIRAQDFIAAITWGAHD